MLSGGASRVEGFAEALHERFNAPVERFDPFKQVTYDEGRLGIPAEEMAAVGAVAVGLALRRAGDR